MSEKSERLGLSDADLSGELGIGVMDKPPQILLEIQNLISNIFNPPQSEISEEPQKSSVMTQEINPTFNKGVSTTVNLYEYTDEPGLVPLKIWDFKTVLIIGIGIYFLLK